MQDQIANPVGFDCSLEEATFGQDPLLSREFLQSSWTHAISQWCKPPALLFSVEGEKILTHHKVVDKNSVCVTTVIVLRMMRRITLLVRIGHLFSR
jgi:hypothetical protein